MSVYKNVNYKIKKIPGMWGTKCKWIEDNFGLNNYWCEEEGVGVLESEIPEIIKKLGARVEVLQKENAELKRSLDRALDYSRAPQGELK